MPALGCSDTALRRDECGDPVIRGKLGHIYAVCGTIVGPKRPGFMIYVMAETSDGVLAERWTSQGWTYAKKALSFAKLTNDGDEEGPALSVAPSALDTATRHSWPLSRPS